MSRVVVSAYRYAPTIGGAENYTRRLLHEMGTRIDVEVVTWLKSQRTDWLAALIAGERNRPETYVVDGRQVTALPAWPAAARRALSALAPAYHFPMSPAPWQMGKLMAPFLAPYVTGTGIVHNVFMGREAFSAAWLIAAERAGRPFVFTPLRHQRPMGWSSRAFRRLYARSDAVVALTHGEADWLVERGADRRRLHVIGLGPQNDVAASPEPARKVLGFEDSIVLFIGQLHTYKGFAQLVTAAQRFAGRSDVRFVFVGPDVRGNAKVFDRAGPNVTWLGSVPPEMRDSLLNACSVLCVPSARESFGSVMVEAWACGKPVVGGPAAATRELIDEGVDGFVVPQDPAVIADRIERLLANPQLARDMGCAGKKKVERNFTWSAIAAAHLEIYERLL